MGMSLRGDRGGRSLGDPHSSRASSGLSSRTLHLDPKTREMAAAHQFSENPIPKTAGSANTAGAAVAAGAAVRPRWTVEYQRYLSALADRILFLFKRTSKYRSEKHTNEATARTMQCVGGAEKSDTAIRACFATSAKSTTTRPPPCATSTKRAGILARTTLARTAHLAPSAARQLSG